MFNFKPVNKQNNQQHAFELIDCLAKTYSSQHSRKIEGRRVLDHCLIVGEVARLLIQRMPHWLRERLFPEGAELIAAAHDVGKISPTFQKKIYCNLEHTCKDLSGLEGTNPDWEKQWGSHAGASQLSVQAYLEKDESAGKSSS